MVVTAAAGPTTPRSGLAGADSPRQQVLMKQRSRVEDLHTDDLAVLPVEDDHPLCSVGKVETNAVPTGRQLLVSEVDVCSILGGLERDPHLLIVPDMASPGGLTRTLVRR